MNTTTRILIKKVTSLSYILGSVSLLAGVLLSLVSFPASASSKDASTLLSDYAAANACVQAFKCEGGCDPDPKYTYQAPQGYQVCKVLIKAGNLGEMAFNQNGCKDVNSDGQPDYCVSGIGANKATARRDCAENGQTSCYAISHSTFYIAGEPTDTPPTNTPVVEPTDTPVPTATETELVEPTDTPAATATETSVTNPTATPTDSSVEDPTDTPTAIPSETPETEPTITPTAMATGTSVVEPTNSPTSTPTTFDPGEPPTGTPEATSTTVVLTDTPTSPPPEPPDPTPTPTEITSTKPAKTPGSASPTPVETLAPPSTTDQPQVLVPETGADLSLQRQGSGLDLLQRLLINLGLGLLGLGFLSRGIGSRLR